jgi:TRAP-type C4-dicarboxylate transport system substrate-binding protein
MESIFGKSVMLSVVLSLVMCMLCPGAVQAGDEVQKIQVASQMPVGHPITKAVDLFCQRAKELSKGRLDLQHFPAGQLLTDQEVPEAISKGSIQMAQTYFPWWSGMIKTLPLYGGKNPDDLDHYFRLARGPLFEYQKKLLAEKGNCRVIAPILYTAKAGYLLNKPVKKLGDMKGMKIRISAKVVATEVQALGGVPTVLSAADIYMALQRKTIDGVHSGVTSFYARKWYEVAKYAFILDFGATDFYIVANKAWFDSLPADLQQVMMKAGQEATAFCTKATLAEEAKAEKDLKAHGVETYQVPLDVYKAQFAPVIEPAARADAVKQFGEELVKQYEKWVDDTRAK